MSSPSQPPSLDHLATRPFSFYPAIVNIEHNEWLFRKATWSEVLVVNCKTSTELWIPRRYIGEVSRVDDPVLIVGLNVELQYRMGTVVPFQRRVIEMPVAVNAPIPASQEEPVEHAPSHRVRAESQDRRMAKLIVGVLAVVILLYLGAANLLRIGTIRQATVYTTKDQSYLALGSHDDYLSAVQKLGPPAASRWQTDTGEIQYQALAYPDRKYTVILMGSDRNNMHYIGAMDDNWKPVHAVNLRSGISTLDVLRELKRF